MHRNSNFYLKIIKDKAFILPIGQMVADHAQSASVNSIGEYIWGLLENDISREDIIQKCFDYYEASDEDKISVKKDIDSFLLSLKEYKMVLEDMKENRSLDAFKRVVIAGIVVGFYGDLKCIDNRFDTFENELINPDDDLRIEIVHDIIPVTLNGKTIIRNSLVNTMECDDRYILKFSQTKDIVECHLSKKGDLARFYTYEEMNEDGKEVLFHAIRTVFLYKALQKGIMAIHSVSIDFEGKAWLFSAPSGTGKSTHATLWNKLFNTEIINGDLNLIGIKNGKAYVYGLPWCGTSKIFSVKEYELGGIFLLKRNNTNFVKELTDERKILLLQQRLISPSWNQDMIDKQIETVSEITEVITVAELNCNKEDEAARVMNEYIVKRLTQNQNMK